MSDAHALSYEEAMLNCSKQAAALAWSDQDSNDNGNSNLSNAMEFDASGVPHLPPAAAAQLEQALRAKSKVNGC